MPGPAGWGSFKLGDGPHSNITVFGANWCPHCHNEMAHLKGTGATFVDCADTTNQKLCASKNIEGYLTIFVGEKSISGEADLETLLKL